MRGERSWFAIDFKSFEIPLEEVGGKLLGRILERGRGFSSWINFWELSLCHLLDGVEACCMDEDGSFATKSEWKMVESSGWSTVQRS